MVNSFSNVLYLAVWTIHILLGGTSWILTSIMILAAFFYHVIFFLAYANYDVETAASIGANISMNFIVHITYMALAYISEKREKVNFCIIRNQSKVTLFVITV